MQEEPSRPTWRKADTLIGKVLRRKPNRELDFLAWSVPCRPDPDGEDRAMPGSLPVDQAPTLSIVIPLLNEEAVLETTYQRLSDELHKLGETYEIVFVDDGSTDRSRAILTLLTQQDAAVRVVTLSRNFGHEMATTAGLHHARGRAAVVMDADLQDPPELIAEFVRKWREGYQVVYGVRQKRQGETVLKKVTSFLFYRLMGQVADIPFPADVGDFRLMDRRVLDVYRDLGEDPRFFRGLITWVGFRQIGVPFVRDARAAGVTRYRYHRLVRLAFDTITGFSMLPALAITLLAFGSAVVSAAAIAGVILLWVVGLVAVPGWGWAALLGLVLWNVQFLALAVLGEYIVRTHRHTQRRPLYIVDAVLGGHAPDKVLPFAPSVRLEEEHRPSRLVPSHVEPANGLSSMSQATTP
jgi:polyisoprenyl-phosphate glycosyltransferase